MIANVLEMTWKRNLETTFRIAAGCTFGTFVFVIALFGKSALADTVLFDSFNDGNAGDGSPANWVLSPFDDPRDASRKSINVANGELNLRYVAVVEDFPMLGDTSVRTRVTLPSDVGTDNVFIGVQTRRNDATNEGYSAALWPTIGSAILVRETGGNILKTAAVTPNVTQEDVMLQFDAIGDILSFWVWRPDEPMPEEPLISVTDATHPEGVISLFSVNFDGENPVGVFRFVQVASTHILSPLGDCDADSMITASDLSCVSTVPTRDAVLDALHTLPGDLDGDGQVAFADFLQLSSNFGKVPASYAEGNVDLLGGVEFADFLQLSSNFGKTVGGEPAVVPEPNAAPLAIIGWLVVTCISVNRKRPVESGKPVQCPGRP